MQPNRARGEGETIPWHFKGLEWQDTTTGSYTLKKLDEEKSKCAGLAQENNSFGRSLIAQCAALYPNNNNNRRSNNNSNNVVHMPKRV
jgi:hypothetical protein